MSTSLAPDSSPLSSELPTESFIVDGELNAGAGAIAEYLTIGYEALREDNTAIAISIL
jgi:hypothetical protein